MQTVTGRSNWQTLSDKEIEKALPWMKITHRYRMFVAVCLLLLFAVPMAILLLLHFINNNWIVFLRNIGVYIGGGFFIFIAVCFVVDYTRKIKCFTRGEFQAVNVTVYDKAVRSGYRFHYYAITVSGLYIDNKSVMKEFRVSRRIYNRVEPGDSAFVIKYNYKKTKGPLSDLDFVPVAEL